MPSKPACQSCGHSKNVVRMWAGGYRSWACRVHSRVAVGPPRTQTLRERVFHRPPPEPETVSLGSVLANRAARRHR